MCFQALNSTRYGWLYFLTTNPMQEALNLIPASCDKTYETGQESVS